MTSHRDNLRVGSSISILNVKYHLPEKGLPVKWRDIKKKFIVEIPVNIFRLYFAL